MASAAVTPVVKEGVLPTRRLAATVESVIQRANGSRSIPGVSTVRAAVACVAVLGLNRPRSSRSGSVLRDRLADGSAAGKLFGF